MDVELEGKTAIVTGASQGIGRAIARALHREGVALVMVARSADRLREAAESIAQEDLPDGREGHAPIYPIAADLGLLGEIERVVQEGLARLGQIDILVNNAAQARRGRFFDSGDEELEAAWQVKALGYARMVRLVGPHMMSRGSGQIINIVGNTARTPTEDFVGGSMVNAALINFTRGIARELARHQVRINSISPGWTLTEGQARSFELQAEVRGTSREEIERTEARAIPLRRLVSMDEIARLVVILSAGLLPSMTGEDILLDGGADTSI